MLLGTADHYFVQRDLESSAFALNTGQSEKDVFQVKQQHISVTKLSAIRTRSMERVELCIWYHVSIRKIF